ncbi:MULTISPECIES: ArsR/SmtB family transcription factor [Dietzia]|uniref:Metalloregulator ArsR/SmtB family transcription factor n=1 Tax=Dietzia cercidiphylli TaxID=498199 RepID=A0ABP4UVX0_9ACTN|nr:MULTISPECIES: metalloregulator ArsR/SmtB family transcription factor [Dietzia]MBB1034761.1 helix-turn-helix transcriptional regulator [Dietzia sp. CQ4]MBB1036979.1 helix-turn-helix transcriptional regulator [Dietzia natronolimnaea]MBB1042409.1 helix-turn-helix transcriptional regulator [Dietzia sp. Cai40]MBB1044275.1 helix-turn-helix transcriptional regulator [Dietzia sp. DQ11-44]MBB1049240.1 helix-turn-helix transcriptional regulator [Dietzia cercidiphylli]
MTSPESAEYCCIAGANGPLTQAEAEAAAARFKALADPMRLRLLSHIAAAECDDVCVCTLTEPLGISQPTVSHHMKKLVEAGLVTREQRGRMAHYSIVPEAFSQIRDIVDVRGLRLA